MLKENPNRFVIFPIEHADIWAKYKQHMSVFWIPEEIDLSKDMKDWVTLNDNERHFIKHVLGFFAGSDGIVMENLAMRFTREVQWPEATPCSARRIWRQRLSPRRASRTRWARRSSGTAACQSRIAWVKPGRGGSLRG
jgi:hypothetical protein